MDEYFFWTKGISIWTCAVCALTLIFSSNWTCWLKTTDRLLFISMKIGWTGKTYIRIDTVIEFTRNFNSIEFVLHIYSWRWPIETVCACVLVFDSTNIVEAEANKSYRTRVELTLVFGMNHHLCGLFKHLVRWWWWCADKNKYNSKWKYCSSIQCTRQESENERQHNIHVLNGRFNSTRICVRGYHVPMCHCIHSSFSHAPHYIRYGNTIIFIL